MLIKFEIDTSNLDLDIAKLENAISKEMEKTANKIERTAKELAPVDTGDLRRSIHVDGGGLEYDISTNVEYAPYMEYGTSPHIIHGNPWLSWKGQQFPVKTVHHPGTKAYKYMTKSFDTHTQDLDVRIANIIEEVL